MAVKENEQLAKENERLTKESERLAKGNEEITQKLQEEIELANKAEFKVEARNSNWLPNLGAEAVTSPKNMFLKNRVMVRS